MNRLGWIRLAVAAWGMSWGAVWADEPAAPRGSASTRLIPNRTQEAAPKVTVEQSGPVGLTPVEGTLPVAAEGCDECSRYPFFDTMAGIKSWVGHRFELPMLRSWAGADYDLLPGDIEDPYWLRLQYMAGWFRRYHVPPMLTTSDPQTSRGILGEEGTRVLFGGDDVDLLQHSGAKFTFGFWLEPSQQLGFETNYFFLVDRHSGLKVRSDGGPLLAAPFFDALNDVPSAFPIANLAADDLDARTGFVDVYANSRLQGFEFNIAHNYFRGSRGRVDFLWGYRYLRLDEGLNNTVFSFVPNAGTPNIGTFAVFTDQFGTENSFHGLNAEFRSQWWWGAWSLDVNSQVAVGVTRATAQVRGDRIVFTPPNNVNELPGGIYALPINSGDATRTRFSTASEIEAVVGYQVYDHVRITVGYSFLFWTGTGRPGDLVDTRINPNQNPPVTAGGPALPEQRFSSSTFWMNSITAGLEIRY